MFYKYLLKEERKENVADGNEEMKIFTLCLLGSTLGGDFPSGAWLPASVPPVFPSPAPRFLDVSALTFLCSTAAPLNLHAPHEEVGQIGPRVQKAN